jgi:hypothetical protein
MILVDELTRERVEEVVAELLLRIYPGSKRQASCIFSTYKCRIQTTSTGQI